MVSSGLLRRENLKSYIASIYFTQNGVTFTYLFLSFMASAVEALVELLHFHSNHQITKLI
jgi:Na+-transporting methylmalonyl-CoA/oxaloacetate decarboxylase gamma subunit